MNNLNPRIVKTHNKNLAVIAFADIDGTINNQDVQEKERLSTINPAKEAIKELQDHDIPVGMVTARSFGETMIYQNALGTQGFTITEDGAVIILPSALHEDMKNVVSHNQQAALILSSVGLPQIKEFLKDVSERLEKKGLSKNIISICTASPQVLKELIHYQTIDDALRAADRLASAFVREITEEQFRIIVESSADWNMRVTGTSHHAHILGKDADKGKAIQFVNDNINLFLPGMKDLDGILPIVFGNDYNDIRLFEEAHEMGGTGIIVKDSEGNYRVPDDEIPSYVIKTENAYGYGMKESINAIFKEFKIM